MMTSGRNKSRPGAAAFTLLEMIAVMAVMVLMLGVAAFAMRQAAPDPTVKKPGDELVRLSKLAVRASAVQGRGFAISFDRGGFSLVTTESGQRDRVTLPKGMKVFIKRWGARDWEPADGHRWWFGSRPGFQRCAG